MFSNPANCFRKTGATMRAHDGGRRLALPVHILVFFSTFLIISIIHANDIQSISAVRFTQNPLIDSTSDPSIGDDIDFPSVIKVPSWIPNPLGKYYLYFGAHYGTFIRLAYSDSITGPWKIYKPGALNLSQVTSLGWQERVGSPDVHIDSATRQIRLYFNSTYKGLHWLTGVAFSTDGLAFTARPDTLAHYYYTRVFSYKGIYYCISKHDADQGGELDHCQDSIGLSHFDKIKDIIPLVRHVGVTFRDSTLLCFYSKGEQAPEKILVCTVRLSGKPINWVFSDSLEVLEPEMVYEGINFPNVPSIFNSEINVRELRDPYIYEEGGKTYLFYAIAGESGIAGAELSIVMKSSTTASIGDGGTAARASGEHGWSPDIGTCKGKVFFTLSSPGKFLLTVYTIRGDKIAEMAGNSAAAGVNSVPLDAINLKPGACLMQLKSQSSTVVKCVTIIR
jgi:hypothetical protein